MLTLTHEHPDFPDDYEFYYNGIGVVKNGETLDISEEQERAFISFYGKTISEAFYGSDVATLGGTAAITDTSEIFPSEISDRPSPDPTAMNLTADGEKFEHANLMGDSTDPDPGELEVVEEEEAPVTTTTTEERPPMNEGGNE